MVAAPSGQPDRTVTGEVSGAELAELGVTLAEIGHFERRTLFGETDEIVARKTLAALRNGLAPVLCVGEPERGDPDDAALMVAVRLWARVHGFVSLELRGHLPHLVGEPGRLYAAEVDAALELAAR